MTQICQICGLELDDCHDDHDEDLEEDMTKNLCGALHPTISNLTCHRPAGHWGKHGCGGAGEYKTWPNRKSP